MMRRVDRMFGFIGVGGGSDLFFGFCGAESRVGWADWRVDGCLGGLDG
jgi:hypothetical protein